MQINASISPHSFSTHSAVKQHAGNTPHASDSDEAKTDNAKEPEKTSTRTDTKELDQQQKQEVKELQHRDREVRAHEAAHKATAGNLAKGGASFSYQRGPDGRLYAVGGEVSISTSPVSGDPQASLQKANQIRAAALAPAQPSSQDRAVAAQATIMAAEARNDIATENREEVQQQVSSTEPDKKSGNNAETQKYQEIENTSKENSDSGMLDLIA